MRTLGLIREYRWIPIFQRTSKCFLPVNNCVFFVSQTRTQQIKNFQFHQYSSLSSARYRIYGLYSRDCNTIPEIFRSPSTVQVYSIRMTSNSAKLGNESPGVQSSPDIGKEGTKEPPSNEGLSKKEKLKLAIRDYGSTVLVFHITMSLASLGIFYLLVSSGLDVVGILEKIGLSESISQSKVTAEAGKFVVAYAVHKVFAPVRITITLTATPLIVRKLRSMGILKQAVKSKP